MSRTQLSRGLSRPDPLMNFRWVTKMIPSVGQNYIGPEFIQNVEIPFSNVAAESIFFCGAFKYFPGFSDISAFNISFYGDSKGLALRYILHWKSLVKDFTTGIYNLPPQYKRSWNFILIDANGNDVVEVELQGCWPADTGSVPLSYESSEAIVWNQNFSTDHCKILNAPGF